MTVKVGDNVWVPFASGVRSGLVIEDRGRLGPGGVQVVRVRLGTAPDEELEFELPVTYLVTSLDPPRAGVRRGK